MKQQGFIQASLLLGVFVVGCSGAVSRPTASESESLSASKPKKDAGACVSQEDGPCGGFTQNPCTCAAGLVCVGNRIPDIPGTCEPDRCCPATWNMYTCNEENGTTGFNCHNPALACASSLTCGGGCDFQVTGQCPVCDPIVCPAGQTFDTTLCKCVPTCTTAADCSGPLPQICQVCSDGGSECAHWACISGECQTVICQ